MSVSYNIRGYIDRRTQDLKERGDAIERRRQIEAPKPITAKAISQPIYNNKGVLDFATWRLTNLQALTDYWNALTVAGAHDILGEEDFHLFTLVQHDSELDKREEYKRCYGSMRDSL